MFQPVDKKGKAVDGKVTVLINEEAIRKDKRLAGYNLLVTSEINLTAEQIYTCLLYTSRCV